MGSLLNKSLILNRLKEHFNLKNNAQLARFLGVAPNTITNWYVRNSIDFDLIISKCENIDLNWLIKGSKLKVYKIKEEPADSVKEPAHSYNLPQVSVSVTIKALQDALDTQKGLVSILEKELKKYVS